MINFIIAVRIVLFFKKYETVANGFVKDGENIQKNGSYQNGQRWLFHSLLAMYYRLQSAILDLDEE